MRKPRTREAVRRLWRKNPCPVCGVKPGDRCRRPNGKIAMIHVPRQHADADGNCVRNCSRCATTKRWRQRLDEWEAGEE